MTAMHVLILGGGGMLGRKLAAALAARGTLGSGAISKLTLADLAKPEPPTEAPEAVCVALDVAERASVDAVFAERPDVVFHLAAIVSGQAEAEFDLGMRINLHGSLNVFEAARAAGNTPVVVFTSSIAAFGGELPENRADQPLEDWHMLNPQTSYGAQKAAAELLLNDYSRKGFLDGRGVRLPTVSVRPGAPNKAASSFMSSIFREPLRGEEAICPAPPEFAAYYLSPRRAVDCLIHAAELDGAALGANRNLTLPGRTHTIGEMIAAMTRVAGPEPARRIRFEPDPVVASIVGGWRAHVRAAKAEKLGFPNDVGFEDNIRYFLEDDL